MPKTDDNERFGKVFYKTAVCALMRDGVIVGSVWIKRGQNSGVYAFVKCRETGDIHSARDDKSAVVAVTKAAAKFVRPLLTPDTITVAL